MVQASIDIAALYKEYLNFINSSNLFDNSIDMILFLSIFISLIYGAVRIRKSREELLLTE